MYHCDFWSVSQPSDVIKLFCEIRSNNPRKTMIGNNFTSRRIYSVSDGDDDFCVGFVSGCAEFVTVTFLR